MKDVVSEVIRKCRESLLADVPILYIKTNSDVLIQKVITNQTDPLVVLTKSGSKNVQSGLSLEELSSYAGRPMTELPEKAYKHLTLCRNYKAYYPCRKDGLLYKLDRDAGTGLIEEPYLWSFKVPTGDDSTDHSNREQMNTYLSQYVQDRENPLHPQYDVLQSSVVLLYSQTVMIPQELLPYVDVIEVGYPDKEEIRAILREETKNDPNLFGNTFDKKQYLSAMVGWLSGFTTEEIVAVLRHVVTQTTFDQQKQVLDIIQKQKSKKLEGGILEQKPVDDEAIGGMENFKKWLIAKLDPLTNAPVFQERVGSYPPKGVLVCGVPGCGKSEAAKFTAQTFGLPLLKMDIGSLMDKFQGVSEQRMRDALELAEAMSPCVLFIDELEKGFSAASGDGDNGSFKRMFGYLLGWLQDNKKPCYIFATANDISGMPKEFFRSGRFDALFGTFLPTANECVSILQTCMKKAASTAKKAQEANRTEICPVFCEDVFSDRMQKRLLEEIVNGKLATANRPRIVIGSDLNNMVTLALRRQFRHELKPITPDEWIGALNDVIDDENYTTYGDNEGNLYSIAVLYAKMLRNGFLPTSDQPLFSTEHYHAENTEHYAHAKQAYDSKRFEGEEKSKLRELETAMKNCEIVPKRPEPFREAYDKAVYAELRKRINEVAYQVEMHEMQVLITNKK